MHRNPFSRLSLIPLVLVSWVSLTSAAEITAEQIVALKSVSQAQVNPSGRHVVYVLSVQRSQEDEPGQRYSEIWVAEMDGSGTRQYTSRPVNSWAPNWSPDGKYITFLSHREALAKETQIYRLPLDGGEAQILTQHKTGVTSYRWSPDGKWIAFTARDPVPEEEQKAEKAGRDWQVMHSRERFNRLWICDLEGETTRQLSHTDLDVRSFVWTPDGKAIIFQATAATGADPGYMDRKIYRLPRRGGRSRQLCDTPGKLGPMEVSPDGEWLAFLGAVSRNDPLPQTVFLVPAKGGEPQNLSGTAEESFRNLRWIDPATLLLLGVRGTRTPLSTIDVTSAEREDILDSDYSIRSFSGNPSSPDLALTASRADHPRELLRFSPEDGGLTRLTVHNPDLEGVQLARQETIEWTARDGLRIEGVLTYPLNYREGRSYPLILQIHGGPEGVSLDSWTTSSLHPVQLFAVRGYMVLQPNYRGSGGRGVAFSKGDHDDLGGREFEDVLTGIEALAKRGLIDRDRVGTGGWSYGGYFSAWAATRHSEHFKAAVVGAGITNMISFMGTTDIPYEMSLVHWNSWWFDQPELHWEQSPLFHINKARTPTLVVHGLKDERVHPEQGLELYQALRIKNVPTQLVLYPRQPHGLVERAHQLDYLERVLDWFDRYVKRSGR